MIWQQQWRGIKNIKTQNSVSAYLPMILPFGAQACIFVI